MLVEAGRRIANWQGEPGKQLVEPGDTVSVFLSVERKELHCRINDSFEQMLKAGALDEARAAEAHGGGGGAYASATIET